MRIVGIDPGTRVAGYGIVDLAPSGRILPVAAGVWRLGEKLPLAARLGRLSSEFRSLADTFKPQALSIELAFVGRNVRSALFLGHARGVVLAECSLRSYLIHEVSATEAKKVLTGFGHAEKAVIARAVSAVLGLRETDLPFDATDALAIAYACAMDMRVNARVAGPGPSTGPDSVKATSAPARRDFQSAGRKAAGGFDKLFRERKLLSRAR